VIIAVHGAGLANLLFARPGATVVELFPEDFVKSTYLWLCNRLGLRHIAVTGSRGSYDQDFRVDPSLFAASIQEAMSAPFRPASAAA
jgi:capsular polysaccharide biosynthesis protein